MFREGALSEMSDLLVAYNGDVLSVVSGAGRRSYFSGSGNFHGSPFTKALSAPLNGVSLIFSITSLPSGTAGPSSSGPRLFCCWYSVGIPADLPFGRRTDRTGASAAGLCGGGQS